MFHANSLGEWLAPVVLSLAGGNQEQLLSGVCMGGALCALTMWRDARRADAWSLNRGIHDSRWPRGWNSSMQNCEKEKKKKERIFWTHTEFLTWSLIRIDWELSWADSKVQMMSEFKTELFSLRDSDCVYGKFENVRIYTTHAEMQKYT